MNDREPDAKDIIADIRREIQGSADFAGEIDFNEVVERAGQRHSLTEVKLLRITGCQDLVELARVCNDELDDPEAGTP